MGALRSNLTGILNWVYATIITIALIVFLEIACMFIGWGSDFLIGFISGVGFIIIYFLIQINSDKKQAKTDTECSKSGNNKMINYKYALKTLIDEPGIKSGFDAIDNITSGWQRGDLIIIAAPERMGKTAFGLSMLMNGAIKYNYSFIWFSTSLSIKQLIRMQISNQTRMTVDGEFFESADEQFYKDIVEQYKDLYFEDKPNQTPASIDLSLQEMSKNQRLPDCIIIDSLNNLDTTMPFAESNDYSVTNSKFLELKAIARKYNIAIIALYECNFPDNLGSEFVKDLINPNFKLSLTDSLYYIYRPEYYRNTEYADGESALGSAIISVTDRYGKTGEVKLKYDARLSLFV